MNIISQTESPFDQIKNIDDQGNEYWLARQLQILLGYKQWQRFEETIERAKIACINIGDLVVKNHFSNVDKMVKRPQGGGVNQSDYKLSRYACYLTAMNGDPRKTEIAQAQSYFAIKTREAELNPEIVALVAQLQSHVVLQQEQINLQQERINRLEQLFIQQQGQQGQIEELGQIALQQDNAIASLQQARVDIPPGWDIADWEALPPQDKKHFLNLWLRDQFNPTTKKEVRDYKREQRKELMEAIGSVGRIDQVRIAEAKTTLLAKFWAQGGQS
ncbi:MAG: DNA-damage-inducible protein [Rhizonema sp. NSF051]|nr:DNA-damage-inducible protein [Rhizonema sp. NSF051]